MSLIDDILGRVGRGLAGGITPPLQSSSPGARWPVRWTVVAQADGMGNVNLILPAPANGITWIGSVALTSRANLANVPFSAYIGQPFAGPPVASWAGASTYGPVALVDMQTLSISGIFCPPGALVQAVFTGVGSQATDAGPVFAAPLAVTTLGLMTVSYQHSGGSQAFTVPNNVTVVQVDLAGAQGGGPNDAFGGQGARVQATLAVTPGQVLTINVGESSSSTVAGYGDEVGGTGSGSGYAGGGSSAIRDASNTLILGAGGGGGAYGVSSQGKRGLATNSGTGSAGQNSTNAGAGGGGYNGGLQGNGLGAGNGGGGGGSFLTGAGVSGATATAGYQPLNGYCTLTYIA